MTILTVAEASAAVEEAKVAYQRRMAMARSHADNSYSWFREEARRHYKEEKRRIREDYKRAISWAEHGPEKKALADAEQALKDAENAAILQGIAVAINENGEKS